MTSELQQNSWYSNNLSQGCRCFQFPLVDLPHSCNSCQSSESVTWPPANRVNTKSYQDEVDIKFSNQLDACKTPSIRHASVERLLDHLTDPRFISDDSLGTFLLTYRIFTTGHAVVEALKYAVRNSEQQNTCSSNLGCQHSHRRCSFDDNGQHISCSPPHLVEDSKIFDFSGIGCLMKPQAEKIHSPVAVEPIVSIAVPQNHTNSPTTRLKDSAEHRIGFQKYDRQLMSKQGSLFSNSNSATEPYIPKVKLAPIASCETFSESCDLPGGSSEEEEAEESSGSSRPGSPDDDCIVKPAITLRTPTDSAFSSMSSVRTQSNLSPGNPTVSSNGKNTTEKVPPPAGQVLVVPAFRPSLVLPETIGFRRGSHDLEKTTGLDSVISNTGRSGPTAISPKKSFSSFRMSFLSRKTSAPSGILDSNQLDALALSPAPNPKFRRATSPSALLYCPFSTSPLSGQDAPKACEEAMVSAASMHHRPSPVSSSLPSSTLFSACMFHSLEKSQLGCDKPRSSCWGSNKVRQAAQNREAKIKVLNILRQWVSTQRQDFDGKSNWKLRVAIKELLEEIGQSSCLLPNEHGIIVNILKAINKLDFRPCSPRVNLEIFNMPHYSTKDNFNTISALEIAEQMTYLDHQIFVAIDSLEFLSQAWMKVDKSKKAPNVLLVSKRFNEASRLVVSEIVSRPTAQERAACIEKWTIVADACRHMQNYNGVLEICAAFVNSSVYRLKKTWEKISKQTKQMVDRLQSLVSSDGRFKNMRDALHRYEPPAIPYLGMYLSDLSFIEEGTNNITEDGLVNFSKMRMIAQVIKDIQIYQQTPYQIVQNYKVINYLLDTSRLLGEEETYRYSLEMEPRTARLSLTSQTTS